MFFTPTTQETVSGAFIDLAEPRPADIKIEDIAWALSRQARYAGHTMCKIPYTVAQHTVMVSRYVEAALTPGTELHAVFTRYIENKADATKVGTWMGVEERARQCPQDLRKMYAFHGLMHDFAEAYLTDIPTPVKRLPGIYEALKLAEQKLDTVIYEAFGLPYSETKHPLNWDFGLMVVHWADMLALSIEAYHFMPSRGLNWNIPLERPPLPMIYSFRWPVPNIQAYEELLARYEELRPVTLPD